MEELENDTNESMLIVSSDLMNPTMQFEGKFLALLVTYIVGRANIKTRLAVDRVKPVNSFPLTPKPPQYFCQIKAINRCLDSKLGRVLPGMQ